MTLPRVHHAAFAILVLFAVGCRDPATVEPVPATTQAATPAAAPTSAVPTSAVPTSAVPTSAVPTSAVPTSAVPTARPEGAGGSDVVPAAVADAGAPRSTQRDPAAATGLGPASLTPLSDEQRTVFMAGEADDPIPVEIHYVQSNETRHDLWFDFVADKGGAFVGVGSDQSFTVMAVQRAEFAFLMDIDYRVVDLHRMYDVLIRAHDNPRALVDAWHERNEASTGAMLAEALGEMDEKARGRLLRGFVTARETVYRHLERVIARTRGGEPTTWLSDADNYAHVRAMYQTGRVRMMPGNLAGDRSLRTVGAAARALGVPVNALYMSNAEEYFKYIPDFVANIEALPTAPGSVVLRTIYSKKWVHADLWAYQVQQLDDFRVRLADKKNRSRNPMLRYADLEGELEKDAGAEGLTLVALERPAVR